MRTAVKILLLLLIVFLSPLFILTFALRMAPLSSSTVKHELVAGNVYARAVTDLYAQIDASVQTGAADDPLTLIGPFIRREITVTYVQKKAETLIDDTSAWLAGRGAPPVLSFKDLKDKLIAQNRDVVTQLEAMSREIAQAQEAAKKEATDQGVQGSDMPSFNPADLQKFLQSDFSIPVGTQFAWVKSFVTFFRSAAVVLGALYLLVIVGMIALSDTVGSRLRWIGMTLLVIAVWNVPGIFVSTALTTLPGTLSHQSVTVSAYAAPVVQAIFAPLLASYATTARTSVFIFGILATLLIIASFIIKTTPASAGKRRK